MLYVGMIGFSIGIVLYCIIYQNSRDVFHPIGLMIVIWYFGSFIASLKLSKLQTKWTPLTCTLILLTGFLMFFWWKVNLHSFKFTFEKDSVINVNRTYKFLTRILFIYCAISCIYSTYTFIAYGNAQTGLDAKGDVSNALIGVAKWVSYGNLLMPYSVLCSIFELQYSQKKSRIYNLFVILFGVFYIWFVSKSRGTLTICLFGLMFMLAKRRKWKIGKAVGISILAVVLLSALVMYRVGSGSTIYNGSFSNPAFNATYNYIATSYENLNDIVSDGSHSTPLANTFILLYKLLGIYKESTMSSSTIYVTGGFYNASPFIGCYYFDMGFLGVLLGVSFISLLILQLYKRSNENIYSILIFSMFQKGVFTICLGDNILNHGSFSGLIGYIVIIAICFLSQSLDKQESGKRNMSITGV
nr:O-antigen polymerase [uncultured Flavobacterium sp.]